MIRATFEQKTQLLNYIAENAEKYRGMGSSQAALAIGEWLGFPVSAATLTAIAKQAGVFDVLRAYPERAPKVEQGNPVQVIARALVGLMDGFGVDVPASLRGLS